jgi:thiamine transporter ThiT
MAQHKEANHPTHRWLYALYIGFFAGLIWGAVQMMYSFLRFSSLPPGFIVEAFFKKSFLVSWQGYMLGWAVFVVFSIAASMLYMLILSTVAGPWAGLGYGMLWWTVIFLLIGPYNGMMSRITRLEWNTIISELCLFLLWGLFIGYSIAFEFNDERVREPFENKKPQPQPE